MRFQKGAEVVKLSPTLREAWNAWFKDMEMNKLNLDERRLKIFRFYEYNSAFIKKETIIIFNNNATMCF